MVEIFCGSPADALLDQIAQSIQDEVKKLATKKSVAGGSIAIALSTLSIGHEDAIPREVRATLRP